MKTKTIGVRFDAEISQTIMKNENLSTYHQILDWLEKKYKEGAIIGSALHKPVDINTLSKETDLTTKEQPSIPKEDNQPMEYTKHDRTYKGDIKQKIAAIRAEKIPPERDTHFGKISWQKEQQERIKKLEELFS